ncbi:MAG TPA: PRC-barrel domain-containing protein [Anaerolineales bacterium]|nr:PRC-barrel domain-containing protein [Anaerolineales bacterium]
MDRTIQLQKNAAVLTVDGQTVGSLNRVVVDSESRTLNAIVVRTGGLFNKEEKVVPISLVAETLEDQIRLNEKARGMDDFPPFEEEISANGSESAPRPAPTENPPLTAAGHPDAGLPAIPAVPASGMVTQVRQNIPAGTIAMEETPKIITLEGIHAGDVERILADPADDHLTHLLVSNGLFKKTVKLIPIQWVALLGMEHIHLKVKKSELDELPEAPHIG